MLKKISIMLFILLLANCVSVGKIGYAVPEEKDVEEIGEEVTSHCNLVLLGFIDAFNATLVEKKLENSENISLSFTTGFMGNNCLKGYKVK